jgi:hypothetical protein
MTEDVTLSLSKAVWCLSFADEEWIDYTILNSTVKEQIS